MPYITEWAICDFQGHNGSQFYDVGDGHWCLYSRGEEVMEVKTEFKVGDIVFDHYATGPLTVREVFPAHYRCSAREDDCGSHYSASEISREPFHIQTIGHAQLDDTFVWFYGVHPVMSTRYDTICRNLYTGMVEYIQPDSPSLEKFDPLDICDKDEVLKTWGATYRAFAWYALGGLGSNELNSFFRDLFSDMRILKDVPAQVRLLCFSPSLSKITPGQISIWESNDKLKTNRKTSMKPGRAIRKMFPELTDAELEKVVDAYRAEFPAKKYTLREGREREDFKKAYSGEMERYENIYTTGHRKSLANSCMRYPFDSLDAHPGEAYASGEFSIFYTVSERGLIGSRCVVWWGKDGRSPVAGPIYGVDETSIDMVQEELDKIGAKLVENGHSWLGAQLLDIPDGPHRKILPYLDCSPKFVNESLVVSNVRGNGYDLSSYEGSIYPSNHLCCENCGDLIYEGEEEYYNDDVYCEHCFDDRFSYCDHFNEAFPRDEMVEVYQHGTWYRSSRLTVHESAVDNGDFIECDSGEIWRAEDVTYVGDIAVDPADLRDNYFQSDWDGEYHRNETLIEVSCKPEGPTDTISLDEIDVNDYEIDEDGVYNKKEGEAA